MNLIVMTKMPGVFDLSGVVADMVSKIVSSSAIKWPINIHTFHLNNETLMSFIVKIIIISIVTALSLFIGGWIASRIIKMENRHNLIDW